MTLGHNNPPDMTVTLGEVTEDLNRWLTDHPVIEGEDAAREAKVLLDRSKLAVKDLEDERDKKVRPLNQQVQEINRYYRPSRDLLQKIQAELSRRTIDYLAKEEAHRIKIAEEARKAAEEAERIARQDEADELAGKAEAADGVIVDVGARSEAADKSFGAFRAASRAAALAEREAKVKIGGGFSRSLSLRNKETLTVADAISAINAIGMTPDIEAAILKGARAYRTLHQELPAGIQSTMERTA